LPASFTRDVPAGTATQTTINQATTANANLGIRLGVAIGENLAVSHLAL
jgi:hypothetical protein